MTNKTSEISALLDTIINELRDWMTSPISLEIPENPVSLSTAFHLYDHEEVQTLTKCPTTNLPLDKDNIAPFFHLKKFEAILTNLEKFKQLIEEIDVYENAELVVKFKKANDEIRQLLTQLKEEKSQSLSISKKYTELFVEHENLKTNEIQSKTDLKSANHRIGELTTELQTAYSDLEKKIVQCQQVQAEIAETSQQKLTLESQLLVCQQQLLQAVNEKQKTEAARQKERRERQELKEKNDELQRQLAEAQAALATERQINNALIKENIKFKAENNKRRAEAVESNTVGNSTPLSETQAHKKSQKFAGIEFTATPGQPGFFVVPQWQSDENTVTKLGDFEEIQARMQGTLKNK